MTRGLREGLESALDDDPDDRATWMALADHLAEAGDPRGELMQVQLALEEGRPAAQRQQLKRREAELLAAHQRDWLGPLAGHLLDEPGEHDRCRWARGTIEELG